MQGLRYGSVGVSSAPFVISRGQMLTNVRSALITGRGGGNGTLNGTTY